MRLEPYKKGQGTLARLAAYTIGALLVGFGAVRFYATFNRPGDVLFSGLPVLGDVSVYKAGALFVGVVGLLALHAVLNRPKSVDLLIDTEQEMKKVSWPTLPQVWNATLVVVLVTFVLAGAMYGFDLGLTHLFRLVF